MSTSITRRGFVSWFGVGVGLGSVASRTVHGQSTAPGTDWPGFQYGHQNRGYNPEIDGLTSAEGETLEHVWSPPVPIHRQLRPTHPVVSDGRLFAAGGPDRDSLVAFDTSDGSEQWRYYMGDGVAVAPAVTGDSVYAFDESGAVHAVEKETGEKRWTRTVGDALGFYNGLVVADGTVYVVVGEKGSDEPSELVAISTDGEMEWSESLEVSGSPFPPTVAENYIFVALPHSGIAIVDTSGNSVDTRTITFPTDDESEHTTAPVVADDRVFLTIGSLIRSSSLSEPGSETTWEFNTAGRINAPVTVTDNRVFATTNNGTVYGLDRSGNRQWERSVAEELGWSPVAAVSDTAYVPTGEELFALDPADGSIRWRYEADEFFGETVIPTEDGLYTSQGKFAPLTATPTPSPTPPADQNTPQLSDDQASTPGGSGPGFGVTSGVAAILGSVAVWRQYWSSED